MLYIPDSLDHFQPRYWPDDAYLAQAALIHDLVSQTSPALLVAVGVSHAGLYFAACQYMRQSNGRVLSYCYRTGAEDDAMHDGSGALLDAHNRRLYTGFSYIMTPDQGSERLSHFEQGSPEFLILGRCVREERDQWLHKLAPGGVALVEGEVSDTGESTHHVLALPEPVTVCFGSRLGPSSVSILSALASEGAGPVSSLYCYIGEYLRLSRLIGNQLGQM